MRFCIDKRVLGSKKHLVVEDGSKEWVKDVPEETWHLSGQLKPQSEWCIDTLLKLNQLTFDVKPEKKYIESIATVVSGSNKVDVPWQSCMPRADHSRLVSESIEQIDRLLNIAKTSYYKGTWVTGTRLLEKLQQPYIDPQKWQKNFDRWDVANKESLLAFKPNKNDEVKKTVYNRFGTRTGRMTVSSGPDILTLKREHRNMLKSVYGYKGVIAYIDFSSLEARVILHESGRRFDKGDIYEKISVDLFANKWPRNTVKLAVLAELYGVSKKKLQEILSCPCEEDIDAFLSCIRAYFDVDTLLKKIKKDYVQNGSVENRYGRRLNVPEPSDSMLLNTYVQSTGVDVSLLGFYSIVNLLERKLKSVRPLYLLHDALIIDVLSEDMSVVNELVKVVKVKGYVQRYHLHVSKI